jgi:DNA-binding GntR family transcriptional regulator
MCPGDVIRDFEELANEYGVSLQPVRQALTRLESAGVVILRMGGRPLVADHGQQPGSSD